VGYYPCSLPKDHNGPHSWHPGRREWELEQQLMTKHQGNYHNYKKRQSQLTPIQQEMQRAKWREQKKRQRQKKRGTS
jgi:hypothetical protein